MTLSIPLAMTLVPLAFSLAMMTASCGGSDGPLDCGTGGVQVDVDSEQYCVYAGIDPDTPVTCPSQLPVEIRFFEGSVCSTSGNSASTLPPDVCTLLGSCENQACEDGVTFCLDSLACCEGQLGTGCLLESFVCEQSCELITATCMFAPCDDTCEAGQAVCDDGCCDSTFVVETVDARSISGTHQSAIALDNAGNPHIAYVDGATLRFASNDGSTWSDSTVEIMPDNSASDLRLETDAGGVFHLTYAAADGGRYASSSNGSDWAVDTLPDNPRDLAIDPFLGPHVLTDEVVYRRDDSGQWVQRVAIPIDRIGRTMDIDVYGQIHILTLVGGTQQYILFTDDGSQTLAQNLSTLMPGVYAGLEAAQCDVEKAVYASYTNSEGKLVIGSKGTGEFTLDTFSRSPLDHRLAVSNSGLPSLLLKSPSDNPPRTVITEFGRWDGDGWSFMDLQPGEAQIDGDGIDLVLDSNGAAHITFYENGQRYVRID